MSAPSHSSEKKAGGGGLLSKVKLPPVVSRSSSGIKNVFTEVTAAVISSDGPTRRAAVGFYISLLGVLVVLVFGFYRWREIRRERVAALSLAEIERRNLSDFLAKQAAEARDKQSFVDLGKLTFEVRAPKSEDGKPVRGLSNLAELELSVKCGHRETREFIEKNVVKIKNQLTGVFTQVERDELLSKDGKLTTKKRIIEKLNNWLEIEGQEGRIQDVYISGLIVS